MNIHDRQARQRLAVGGGAETGVVDIHYVVT